MMCISLFSYGRPVVVRCMGGSVGYVLVGSVIWWVGLGWVDENRPMDNSVSGRVNAMR